MDVESIDSFVHRARPVLERLDTMNDEEKTEVFDLLIDRIVIGSDGFDVTLKLDGVTEQSLAR